MRKNDYVFRYRVRNWRDYNRALIARGRLTFWFDEDAIAGWRNTELRSGLGTPKIYSDTAIQCALVLKSVFHLSLRATRGFLGSVVELMKLELPVPDYRTVSRRQGSLTVSLPTGLVAQFQLRRKAGATVWWWTQSPANPLPQIPCLRENLQGIFSNLPPNSLDFRRNPQ